MRQDALEKNENCSLHNNVVDKNLWHLFPLTQTDAASTGAANANPNSILVLASRLPDSRCSRLPIVEVMLAIEFTALAFVLFAG